MRDKLGLSGNEDGDLELVRALLQAMHENAADFTLTFRRFCDAAGDEKVDANVRGLFVDNGAYDSWAARWRSRLALTGANPTHAFRRCRTSIRPSSRAIIASNKRSTQRSSLKTFHRLPIC